MHILATFPLIFFTTAAALPAGNLTGSARIDIGIGANVNNQVYFNGNQNTGVVLAKTASLSALVPERPKGREEAVLEVPSGIQKKDLVYDYAQQFAANVFHPKPIVDTIAEHEKYGNTGDKFRPIGNAIVGGYEGFSNFINAAVDLPFEAMKQVTRKATSYFSAIGAKLVGL